MRNGNPASIRGPVLALCSALCLTFLAWRTTAFLTDDAFIMFRYVSNSQLGLGYVWNAPPFRPVEGYTSFLWVVLLDGVWTLTKIEPPTASNVLSLLFSGCTLGLATGLTCRLVRNTQLARLRTPLVAVVLLGIVTNRTFLFATSSGLETALQNALSLAWLFLAVFPGPHRAAGLLLSSTAALLSLCRPEGLVYVGATIVVLGILRLERGVPLWTALPLLAAPMHVLWRHAFYGEWLPNTYYAKVVRPWPEAGARYLASFLLEFCWWLPGLLIGAAVAAALFRTVGKLLRGSTDGTLGVLRRIAAISAPVAVAGYYTFDVGGDYFEYRPYSGLPPLLFLATIWAAFSLSRRVGLTVAALSVTVLATWPLSWTHFRVQASTYELFNREQTPIAPHVPIALRRYVTTFDDLQAWLNVRMICRRYHMHRAFLAFQRERIPSRNEWKKLLEPERGRYPIAVSPAAGYAGWVLEEAALLDPYGLNDHNIARSRVTTPNHLRKLGHDRWPTQGYFGCFRPNVDVSGARVTARDLPFTAASVVACEREFDPAHPAVLPIGTFSETVPMGRQKGTVVRAFSDPQGLPLDVRIDESFGQPCRAPRPDRRAVKRRYESVLRVEKAGIQRFSLVTDDDGALYVGGTLVLRTASLTPRIFHLKFEEPGGYDIVLENINRDGVSCAELRLGPSGEVSFSEPIPRDSLSVPLGSDALANVPEGVLEPAVPSVRGLRNGVFVKHPDGDRVQAAFDAPCAGARNRDDGRVSRRYESILDIPEPGTWTFRLITDDGGRMYVNGRPVAETTTLVVEERTLEIGRAGGYSLAIEVDNQVGPSCLVLYLRAPGSPQFREVDPRWLYVPRSATGEREP